MAVDICTGTDALCAFLYGCPCPSGGRLPAHLSAEMRMQNLHWCCETTGHWQLIRIGLVVDSSSSVTWRALTP